MLRQSILQSMDYRFFPSQNFMRMLRIFLDLIQNFGFIIFQIFYALSTI